MSPDGRVRGLLQDLYVIVAVYDRVLRIRRSPTLLDESGRQRIARGRDRQRMSQFFFLFLVHASASAVIRVIDTTGPKE